MRRKPCSDEQITTPNRDFFKFITFVKIGSYLGISYSCFVRAVPLWCRAVATSALCLLRCRASQKSREDVEAGTSTTSHARHSTRLFFFT